MEFVDRPYAVCATGRSHAIDISAPIYSDSRARARAIVTAGERMNDGLRPRADRVGELVTTPPQPSQPPEPPVTAVP